MGEKKQNMQITFPISLILLRSLYLQDVKFRQVAVCFIKYQNESWQASCYPKGLSLNKINIWVKPSYNYSNMYIMFLKEKPQHQPKSYLLA